MLRQWLRRFPKFKRRTYEGRGFARVPEPTGSGRGYTFSAIDSSLPLEQRVEALERRVRHLREQIDEARRELEQELHKVANSIREEQSIRTTEDQKILSKPEATETGGLHISAMGAIWIFFGIIFSSISKELSAWLS